MKILAHLEAHIDFPDEDIAPDTRAQLLARLRAALDFMDELLRTAGEGQTAPARPARGHHRPAQRGKSSLLNRLLGRDRAIVSPIPGTTRDTIEETANVRGLPVLFIDTAGLRESANEIEQEGVRRSRQSLAEAELILHVLDTSEAVHARRRRSISPNFPASRASWCATRRICRPSCNCPPAGRRWRSAVLQERASKN